MKKSKITKKELAAVLRESVFAPNKPGPLKVIVDVGDSRYYMQRALELIVLSLQSPTAEQQRDYLGDAITLLGVAKHTIKTEIRVIHPENWDAKTLAGMENGKTKPIDELIKTRSSGHAKRLMKPESAKPVIGRSKIPGDLY